MKIIVSEDGHLWNDKNPILEQYAEDVIVISYYMREPYEHEKKYKYIDVKIPAMLGMDENGALTSIRYRCLNNHIEELLEIIDWDSEVLVLSDNESSTLYPYKLLQTIDDIRLHLWTVKPFPFESRKRISVYNELVADLSNTVSVLAMRFEILEKHRNMKMGQFFEDIQKQIEELFPQIYAQIRCMYDHYDRKYFFDFNEGAYIDTNFEKGFIQIDNYDGFDLLGDIDDEGLAVMEKENQMFITPRSDGKELCNVLKKARNELAKANGIEFHTEEYPFDGACGGTCPKCDEESRYLISELEKIRAEDRVYPQLEIEERFVSGHDNELQTEVEDEPFRLMGVPGPMPTNDSKNGKSIKIPDFLRRDSDE